MSKKKRPDYIKCPGDLTKISDLAHDPKNARKHDAKNLAAIRGSYTEFGQRRPIVIADGMVIAGNGQLTVARELGWDVIATVDASDLDEEQRTAFGLADNRTAELAEWDDEQLGESLKALADVEFDLPEIGFDDVSLVKFLAKTPTEGAGENAPEPQTEVVTEPGDVWVLGDHRILCGDSTKREDVERVLDGATPALMVTDPPYGVEYDPEWRVEAAAKGQIAYGATRTGKVSNDDRVDWKAAWELSPAAVVYCWHSGIYAHEVIGSLLACDYYPRSQIIWAKPTFAMSRGHYHWQHEPCVYAVKRGKTAGWVGDRKQATVWEMTMVNDPYGRSGEEATEHSTQKPMECMARPIRNHSGDVYEPFLGSGTTLIAAERLDRSCYAIEIEPRYVDVAVRRWMAETGEAAVRESDGVEFPSE